MKPALTCTVALAALAGTCHAQAGEIPARPNIVLILADDLGYECLGCNGSVSYKTPNLDRIANRGIRFTHCIAQPLCTPSRIKLMTGKYNYRNYEFFGYMNPSQKTVGNYLKEAGYKTCIAGKWQLNGLAQQMPGYTDTERPRHFGFDEYCLWQLTNMPKEGERYANPFIIQNGKKLGGLENAYGPDVFNEFVCDFIDRQGKEQFFVYYPMVLVHDPFVPTPESPEWSNTSGRYEKNTRHFREMVEYMDKLVGKLEAKLREKGVLDNTIFIFTGDNGTNVTIATETVSGTVKGAKSFTIDAGCHVPLIISWPSEMKNSRVYQPLIEFSDFLPTLVEAAGTKNRPEDIDGKSFLKVLKGETRPTRETVFVHYDPQWGKTGENRNRFAQTTEYKLYRDQRFYKYSEDLLEQHPLTNLTPAEKAIRQNLQSILDRAEKESPWILERPKATGNQ